MKSRRTPGRICRLAAFVLLAAVSSVGAPRWTLQYFYDVIDWQYVIADIAFPSPRRGVAVGYRTNGSKVRPYAVVTSDGGRTWSEVKLKERPLSLFFLNETIGWMVTERGLWQTLEAGRNWRRITKHKRKMLRVWFVDERRGWAVGRQKSIWQTADGGRSWEPLPVAAAPKTTKEYTQYTWITFANPYHGAIVGYSQPPRRRRTRLPAWMDPERASREREWPTLSIVIQTTDGGETWRHSTLSMFGYISRLRLRPDGSGLVLVRFRRAFRWPSEVYRIDIRNNETDRVFRRRNRAITDIVLSSRGRAYLAGYEPVGTLLDNPVPGRVVVLYSDDFRNWREMKVDYRANAKRVVLAAAGEQIWAATDTGMILKLADE